MDSIVVKPCGFLLRLMPENELHLSITPASGLGSSECSAQFLLVQSDGEQQSLWFVICQRSLLFEEGFVNVVVCSLERLAKALAGGVLIAHRLWEPGLPWDFGFLALTKSWRRSRCVVLKGTFGRWSKFGIVMMAMMWIRHCILPSCSVW